MATVTINKSRIDVQNFVLGLLIYLFIKILWHPSLLQGDQLRMLMDFIIVFLRLLCNFFAEFKAGFWKAHKINTFSSFNLLATFLIYIILDCLHIHGRFKNITGSFATFCTSYSVLKTVQRNGFELPICLQIMFFTYLCSVFIITEISTLSSRTSLFVLANIQLLEFHSHYRIRVSQVSRGKSIIKNNCLI